MQIRIIEVSIDTFAALWAIRQPDEQSEEDIIARLLRAVPERSVGLELAFGMPTESEEVTDMNKPKSVKWTEVLLWTLSQLGGQATLEQIYRVSREGRRKLNRRVTREHDASARECLESHCSESKKWRGKADLFYMPQGKGAGIWALRHIA